MEFKLKTIQTWLKQEIVPIANQLDYQPQLLKLALQSMGDRSLLGLKVPTELGGLGLTELEYHCWQMTMARASGALTFLQTQHQSALGMLAKSQNSALQQEFLTKALKDGQLIGVGFSHLRRRGKPCVQATKTRGGYLLTGTVPWITGWEFFDYFIMGAALVDGRELYALMPLQNQSQDSGGSICFSPPMDLIGMTATNTVSARVAQWYLASDRLVMLNPPGSIQASSRHKVLNHGFSALGCAYAGLDILAAVGQKKQLSFIQAAWQSLHDQVIQCQKEYEQALADGAKKLSAHRAIADISSIQTPDSIDLRLAETSAVPADQRKLKLRARAISLAQRCSQAAVIASSGGANEQNSSAGRVYREALLFSVSGQTTEVMAASLEQLMFQQLL